METQTATQQVQEQIELERAALAAFLERDPDTIKFDWNTLHDCYMKLCGITTGKSAIDLELIKQTDYLADVIKANVLADAFANVLQSIAWYENFFKQPRKKRSNESVPDTD